MPSSFQDDKIKLAEEAKSSLDMARELADSGKYYETLECYLFAFDNSWAVDEWDGARLSIIPAEIMLLSEHFPAARRALQIRRDATENQIRNGNRDEAVVAEWSSLNHHLEEQEREIALLNELEDKSTETEALKKTIVRSNYDKLLDEENYAILSEHFDELRHRLESTISHYQTLLQKPPYWASQHEMWRATMCAQGSKLYQVALSTNRQAQAEEICEQVFRYCNNALAFNLFITAALKVGNQRKAAELQQQAKKSLSTDEASKVVC